MTSPQQPRSSGLDANARGIAVLVAALLIGFLLLLKAGGPGGTSENVTATPGATTSTVDTSGLGDGTTTTTTIADGATTTSTTAGKKPRTPGEVTVVVLNSSGPPGSAKTNTATIKAAGFKTGNPDNAGGTPLAATAVYFAPGYQAEATAVAAVLGKAPAVVAALPSPAPGATATAKAAVASANVVVVLGKDTVAAGTGAATTTSTTTP